MQLLLLLKKKDLQFGFHAITIIAITPYLGNGSNKSGTFHVSSILFDPLPKYGEFKLGYNDAEKVGIWNLKNDKKPYFSSSDSNAKITFNYFGTRFWITGVQDISSSKPKITLDNNVISSQDINFIQDDKSGGSFSEGNKAVIFYTTQDIVLELTKHTVSIEKTDSKNLSILNFFYVNHPNDAICIPAKDMIINGNWKKKVEDIQQMILIL